MSASNDVLIKMQGPQTGYQMYDAVCDLTSDLFYVRLPRTATLKSTSVFDWMSMTYKKRGFTSHGTYYHRLEMLLLYADAYKRLNWYQQVFPLLRRYGCPKLLVDLILCHCALHDRPLNFAIAQGVLTRLSLREFFRQRRPFIDVPVHTQVLGAINFIISFTLNQKIDPDVYLILPHVAERQEDKYMAWCSLGVPRQEGTHFEMHQLPDATFVVMSIDRSLLADHPHDVFTPLFSSLQVCIGTEKVTFDYADVFWFTSASLSWFFVPLRDVDFGCRFDALSDTQKLMDKNGEKLTLTVFMRSPIQSGGCAVFVGMLQEP